MPTAVVGVRFSPPFVCLFDLLHNISKTNAARITKRDIQMFHDESWKPIYFGTKSSKVEVMSSKDSDGVGLCTVVSCLLLL